MKQHNNKTLKEHLSANDLKWLVNDGVLIDMHKTKLGKDKDYIVLSIAVNDKTPANDLAKFLETGTSKFEDVEVSAATDSKGRYLVYVEVLRNSDAYDSIAGMLADCSKLSGIEQWQFKTMGLDSYVPFDKESFAAHVLIDPNLYEQQHPESIESDSDSTPTAPKESVHESIKNRLKFLLNY